MTTLLNVFGLYGGDGKPSHSKVLATIGYLCGWAFLFIVRPHEMTFGWTTYVVILNGLPWGLNGYKAALAARRPQATSDT